MSMRSAKQWVFILIALIMIGAVAAVILINKEGKIGKETKVSDTIVFSDEIREIVVEIGACEFELRESLTGETKVEFEEIKEKYFTGEVKDGVLTLCYEPSGSVNVNIFGIHFDNGVTFDGGESKIVLFLPKEASYENVTMRFGAADVKTEQIATKQLNIEVGAGKFEADTLYAETSAKLSVGAGAVYASKVTLANAELNCGVGEMELSGTVTGTSFVDCGVGEVEIFLDQKQEEYRGTLDCGLGEIVFGDISVDGSGKKEFGDSSAAYRMDVKCGVGEVEIHFE